MKKTYIIENVPKAIGPYSHATEVNGMFFLSGQLGINPDDNELVKGGAEEETSQIMKNISTILKKLGLNFSNIVKSTIFFTNIDDFSKINKVYGSYFDENFPARSAVEISKLAKGANVEIEIIAIK
jgi:2-iminobutanoate/2-iminopropanoate deaminase